LAKRVLVFDTDQIICSPGDPASSVFYVLKGTVKLSVLSPQGKEAVSAILSAGQFVGEACVGGEAMDVRRAKGPILVSVCYAVRQGSDGKGNDPPSPSAPLHVGI
jgi:CRP-like cAMP-binding protein